MYGVAIFMFLLLVIIFTLLGTLVYGKNNAPHQWVAVGTGDVALAISSDGKNWDGIEGVFGETTVGTGNDVFRIPDGRWVVVGDDETDNNIWWSDNGEDWSSASGPYGSGYINSVSNWSGIWVITGKDENNEGTIWWSYDAEEWTEVEIVAFEQEGKIVINIGGTWLAGGTMNGSNGEIILRSEDGIVWDLIDFPETEDDSYINIFYQHIAGGIVLAGGNDIWYSMDKGLTWNDTSGNGLTNIEKILFLNKRYYAFGDNGSTKLIFSSCDGINWTEENIPTSITSSSQINSVKIINEDFYAVGQINGDGGYLVGTPSDDIIAWSRGTDENFSSVDTFKSIDKQRNGSYVLGGSDSDISLIYSDSGNSDSWIPVEDNPFGDQSSVLKVLYS